MISFKKLFTKNSNSYREQAYYVFGRNPHTDWRILLGFFLLLVLGFGFFNMYLYFQIGRGEFFVSQKKDTNAVLEVKKEDLTSVLDFFNKEDQTSRSLKDRAPTFIDPSL